VKPIKLPPELERYRLLTLDGLGALPPIEPLPGTPLVARQLQVLYGLGGCKKTFTALAWSCALVAAGHFVVYIAAEGAQGAEARIKAWMQAHGVDELPTLRVMPATVNLHDRKSVSNWLEAMEVQLPDLPVLVVVDTLARNFLGGAENNPKDMGEFIEGCETIRRALECAVLVVHHTNEEGVKERGTKALRFASFAMLKLVSADGSMVARLEVDRVKELATPAAQKLHFELVEFPEPVAGISSTLALKRAAVDHAEFLRVAQDILVEPGNELSGNAIMKEATKRKSGVNRAAGLKLLKAYAADSERTAIQSKPGKRAGDSLYSLTKKPIRVVGGG
jgi:hypothetical protein